MAELHDSKKPVLITERGQPSAYFVDVNYFEMMQNRKRILEGFARSDTAITEGRIFTQKKAKKKMGKWLKQYGLNQL